MDTILRLNAALDARTPLAAAVDAAWGEILQVPATNDDECIALDDADLFDVRDAA